MQLDPLGVQATWWPVMPQKEITYFLRVMLSVRVRLAQSNASEVRGLPELPLVNYLPRHKGLRWEYIGGKVGALDCDPTMLVSELSYLPS